MAAKQHTNTSTRSVAAAEPASPVSDLRASLLKLESFAKTAAKHRFKLGTHNHYAPKAHAALVEIRRQFLGLKSAYPPDQHPAVATQLDALDAPLTRLEQGLDLDPRELKRAIRDVSYKVGSDVCAAIQSAGNPQGSGSSYITPEILQPGVYRKVLEEANRCYSGNCPNACAAMLRRLVESLIIEAYEAHKIEARIKDGTGEYLELKALIGKAVAEQDLKLSRNTKNALPNLKFLGDLSVHSRRNLIRYGDLGNVQKDARVAIEELASHMPKA
jgi:hypothetical protein